MHSGFYESLHCQHWEEVDSGKGAGGEDEGDAGEDESEPHGAAGEDEGDPNLVDQFFKVKQTPHNWGWADPVTPQGKCKDKHMFHQILEEKLFPRMAEVKYPPCVLFLMTHDMVGASGMFTEEDTMQSGADFHWP